MEGEPVTAEENRMEGESVIGDENAKTSWVVLVENMLADGEPRSGEQSIYRVPKLIKDMNSKAYQPQLVSLGPFHHGDSNLLPMEEHKRRALVHLVKRSGKPLQDFITAVEEVADKLEAEYGKDLDDRWRGENRHLFVEMMVTDGCFLLEILMGDLRDYVCWSLGPAIRSDMLVMENQLPLLLLHRLYRLVPVRFEPPPGMLVMVNLSLLLLHRLEAVRCDIPLVDDDMGEDITRLVLKFIDRSFQGDVINLLPLKSHPLDLYYRSLVNDYDAVQDHRSENKFYWTGPQGRPFISIVHQERESGRGRRSDDEGEEPHREAPSYRICFCRSRVFEYLLSIKAWFTPDQKKKTGAGVDEYKYDTMPSAMKIHESGIKFRKSKTNSLNDIHFEHGVLSMPVLEVADSTEYLFLNLMAFERLHVTFGTQVTDYVNFMDNIIDSAEDVALLRSKGILKSLLGSNEAVATLFNGTLSRGTVVLVGKPNKLHELQWNVTAYCKKPWKKWRAHLIQTYFRNPWAFISLVAAVILLAATLLQTVYTVMQFKSKP